MNKIIFILTCLILSGCTTTGYYTNPTTQGYSEQNLGGLCEKCGRVFAFSGSQLENQENIVCPYCDQEQALQLAANRYAYEVQQQQKQQQAAFLTGLKQKMDKADQRRYELHQESLQAVCEHFKPKKKKKCNLYEPYGQTPIGRIEEE